MKKKKLATLEDIREEYVALTMAQKVITLSRALDYMQEYNGRSRWTCIAMALGYEYDGCYFEKEVTDV